MKHEIDNIIDNAISSKTFGDDFKFRKNQREIIFKICETYIEDPTSTLVIDAPTGSGKSLIAMWSSHILKELGNTGYLITSDLSLQDQYESDFYKYGLRWPSIRGVDNYECSVNGLSFSLGDCRLKGMSYDQAKSLHCYASCDYFHNRDRSITQPISLLNYSFWLIQRNYVEDRMEASEKEVPFKERDFVFFDEAHKVDDIVQNHFSPKIDYDLVDRIIDLSDFLMGYGIISTSISCDSLNKRVKNIIEGDKVLVLQELEALMKFLEDLNMLRKNANTYVKRFFDNKIIPRDWQRIFSTFDRIKDVHCKVEDYLELIGRVGIDKMVMDQEDEEAKFMCVDSSGMIKRYLHNKAKFKVFMSATIGNPESFMSIMGIENAKFIRLGNSFNYDKSPIVFINRHKLSVKERAESLPKVVKLLDKIISKHKGQRGIIHCGSYEFMNYIKTESKHIFRLVDYGNSKEKSGAIETFKNKHDGVLIGPSILEGLDLSDDTSRFQIFFKVPYPYLGDPLIKAKMKESNEWYEWKTGISVLQGVGRSVRNEDDWAVTYVLDACFNNLLKRNNFLPPSFMERIKILK